MLSKIQTDHHTNTESIIKSNPLKYFFIESYGCQMNISDSEIVASILKTEGYHNTENLTQADIILMNTCSIRENAELKVKQRLYDFKKIKKIKKHLLIGILGCMAERLKKQLLEEDKLVDMVVGPDGYRDLPNLIKKSEAGHQSINVILSKEETYADISPLRLDTNGVSAYISIMRGCDNMCSFCVVPFTRGRERSRDPKSILNEAETAFNNGYKEVILLGQNVNSYLFLDSQTKKENITPEQKKQAITFAQLLIMVAQVNPMLRVRYSTSHPKDMGDDVLHAMAQYDNICKHVHLPVQSGNSEVLEKMNRGYTREWYLNRINAIQTILPDASISTDIITGFCDETEAQHQDTISLMELIKFEFAYMFSYSERPKTLAERKYTDNVPNDIKSKHLTEIVNLQRQHSEIGIKKGLGKVHKVLVDSISKKSPDMLAGRNSQNSVVVFPKQHYKIGDYVDVLVDNCTSGTLIGMAVNN